MADAATGSSGVIRIDVSESGLNPGANNSQINWAFYLIEASTNNSTWTGESIAASVDWVGHGVLWLGGFSFDWRGAGNQVTLIASGAFNPGRNPDGSGTIVVRGNIAATGTSGAGGPTSVDQTFVLAKLTQAPGTPTNVTATRTSDTRITLSWQQSSPSNGQPTSNDIIASVNNGAWGPQTTISPANSATLSAAPNQKIFYQVRAYNPGGGHSGWSSSSNTVYTTPAAPTNAKAVKGTDLGITVTFTKNVAYAEHNHEVWHGVSAGGIVTWDSSPLATLASGVTSYKHAAPNPSQVHVYRVRAKAGSLFSGYSTTSSVQLLVAPNKPTVPAIPPYADAGPLLTLTWQHNSVDTTPQKFYELGYSMDSGATWQSFGKTASAMGSVYVSVTGLAPGTTFTTRVRTWGSATTGGADGTGASPWSNIRTVTFQSVPTARVAVPADGDVYNDAALRVDLGFEQLEGATFVRAELELRKGLTLLESKSSAIQYGIAFDTIVDNQTSYTVRARVQSSHGLWSPWASSTFSVVYLSPVAAVAAVSYLPDSGFGQINIVVPIPEEGEDEAATITITRTIEGLADDVAEGYPITRVNQLIVNPDYYVIESPTPGVPGTGDIIIDGQIIQPDMTFLDTTPTINGTNTYTITTTSALGAQSVTIIDLVTTECRRAFLSKGADFNQVAVFGGNLRVSESLSVANDTFEAAGRLKPIGLFGKETSVQLKVQSLIFENFGSTTDVVRAVLLMPGRACYRDSSGRRLFGAAKGSVAYSKVGRADLSFTITETS